MTMALRTKKVDAAGRAVDVAAVYVCIESFGTTEPEGGCAAGTRLRGSSVKVQKWPFYFIHDGADDTEIFHARQNLNNAEA
jgi:hypothetical protein